jgi:hypothetical protein
MAGDAPERTAGSGDRIAPSLALGAWLQILCKRNQTTRSVMSNIPATSQSQAAALPSRPTLRVLDFKPVRKGTLRGFASVKLPCGLVINDVVIGESSGK